MKRFFFPIFCVFILVSCQDNEEKSVNHKDKNSVELFSFYCENIKSGSVSKMPRNFFSDENQYRKACEMDDFFKSLNREQRSKFRKSSFIIDSIQLKINQELFYFHLLNNKNSCKITIIKNDNQKFVIEYTNVSECLKSQILNE